MTSGVTGGRTLWLGAATTQRHKQINSICSTSRGPRTPVTQFMRQAVDEVYRQWLPLPEDWTPEQQDRYLEQMTSRLDNLAIALADSLATSAITLWTQDHGEHPDYLTTVGLREVALQNARETIVRQELYDLIPQDEQEETIPFDPPLRQPIPASQVPWHQRWNDARYRSEPGEELEALAERVWPAPQFSVMFRIKVAYLLIARVEDDLPVPDGPQHPLAQQLAPMVYEDLQADGYPAQ